MQLIIKKTACDCEYDDFCDHCECTHDDHCSRHEAENKEFASLCNELINKKLDILRRICMFINQNPTYFENHDRQYNAAYKILNGLNDDNYLLYTTLKLLSSLKN